MKAVAMKGFLSIEKLAWEPSFAWKLNFCYNSTVVIKTKLRTHGSTQFQNKIWGKSVEGLISYDRTYKQTEITIFYI